MTDNKPSGAVIPAAGSPIAGVGFSGYSASGELALLDASLAKIAEMGADVAEIGVFGFEVISGGRVIPERLKQLQAITRRYPLKYSVHGLVSGNLMDARDLPRQKAVTKAMLEICDALGSSFLVQHSGNLHQVTPEAFRQGVRREQDALAELGDVAQGYGVRIGVENLFVDAEDDYCLSPAELAQSIRTVDHPSVCGVLDFSHAYIECTRRKLDWRREMKAMLEVAGHLHVHDSFGIPEDGRRFFRPSEATALGIGDLHMPLGWGDIPWTTLFDGQEIADGTLMILEIKTDRFGDQQSASLAGARRLAALACCRR